MPEYIEMLSNEVGPILLVRAGNAAEALALAADGAADNDMAVTDAEAERCCFCGTTTTAGIYVRYDPRDLSYTHSEEG